jgi:hypothetical protein
MGPRLHDRESRVRQLNLREGSSRQEQPRALKCAPATTQPARSGSRSAYGIVCPPVPRKAPDCDCSEKEPAW